MSTGLPQTNVLGFLDKDSSALLFTYSGRFSCLAAAGQAQLNVRSFVSTVFFSIAARLYYD